MEEIIKLGRTDTMTSLEIAEITNKQHKDVMRSIRNMEVAWEKVNGRKFALVDYTDQKGEKRPCYQLTKTECLYIATKFNDEARAKLVLRWEELEKKERYQVPQSFSEALMLAAKHKGLGERLRYLILLHAILLKFFKLIYYFLTEQSVISARQNQATLWC